VADAPVHAVHLEHFDFETLRSTFTAKVNFAYASRAGGGASRSRRQSNFKVKLLWNILTLGIAA
jgi:hypothetical protein